MTMQARDLMRGFPPPVEAQVTLANWRESRYSRWAFQNVRNLVPSASVPRALDPPPPFARSEWDLSPLTYDDRSGRTLTVEAMLVETWTDALVVLHRRQVIYERYENGLEPEVPHILFSVSKSVTASLAGVLVERGLLDPDAPISRYTPELSGSAYADATVRQLLDMTVGVGFVENYEDRRGDMFRYRMATGWHPRDGGDCPVGLRSFLATLPKEGEHGERFHYVSPSSDLLGWVLERASGISVPAMLSEWLWKPMGAEHDAYITVDPLGAPRTAGGFCTSARDLARSGQLMLEQGQSDGRQVIPRAWVDDILNGGDRDVWLKGDFAAEMPNVNRYRSQWYRMDGSRRAFCGLGVYGQALYVDLTSELVIAKFSSQPKAVDPTLDDLTFRACEAIIHAVG